MRSRICVRLQMLAFTFFAAANPASPVHAATQVAADIDVRLAEVDALYATGDYESASRHLNDLLIHDEDLPPDRRARVFLLKARLEMAFGRQDEVRLWLAKAHAVGTGLTLDPVKDPPALVTVWNELRKRPPAKVAKEEASRGRFLLGLLPFGIGHFDNDRAKDGTLFLATEGFFGLSAATLAVGTDESAHRSARFVGTTSLLGAYGYELYDLLPDLRHRDAAWTGGLRWSLEFFPFGVGQAVNGEPFKAFGFATAEAVLLTATAFTAEANQRRAATTAFGVVWGYSILDGILNHQESNLAEQNHPEKSVFCAQVLPVLDAQKLGWTAALQTRF